MNAIQYSPGSKQIKLVTLPIPAVTQPDDVLIKVGYSGVCGTDLHVISGDYPCSSKPVILGHEFSGVVVATHSSVSDIKPGDHVVVDPNCGCDRCPTCHAGKPHFCVNGGIYANIGTKTDGGFANYCVCTRQQVHKISTSLPLDIAALIEPLSCISHGWDLIRPIDIGKKILIVGAGIIGTLWMSLLHLQGHRDVSCLEINPKRRSLLNNLMNNLNFNWWTVTESSEIFDLVIDCTGNGTAIENGLKMLSRGGKMCIFGVAPPSTRITISPFEIYMKELTILSVRINPYSFPKAIALVEAMTDRYLNFERLGVKIYNLEDYDNAFGNLKTGEITKAVFQIN